MVKSVITNSSYLLVGRRSRHWVMYKVMRSKNIPLRVTGTLQLFTEVVDCLLQPGV